MYRMRDLSHVPIEKSHTFCSLEAHYGLSFDAMEDHGDAVPIREAGVGSGRTLEQMFYGFTDLIETTHCPYAPRAGIKLIPRCYEDGSADFVEVFQANLHWLKDPVTDAVVIAIEQSELGSCLFEQSRTFRTVLELVSGTRDFGGVLTPGWQLEIAGTRVFATFFSPIYPENNPRAVRGGGFGYVMLQPEHSFHRLLPREKLDSAKRETIKGSIRRAFCAAGSAYDPLDTVPATEAQKYVKPLCIGDPIVAWWSSDTDDGYSRS